MKNDTDNIIKINKFREYYEAEILEHLQIITNNIINEFKKNFVEHAEGYDLVMNNSVYESIPLYDFSDRVKDATSLFEKLKNKRIIFDLFEKFDISSLEKENEELRNYFYKEIDDIIGIKILTSLNEDCPKVLKLIQGEIVGTSNKIELNLNENIPTIMNNGREIYKIKGCYEGKYSFELQIKSKIDSAWGELEHSLFYKDYDFSFIKKNNNKIMVNVGSLLEQVDKLISSLRNSKEEYVNESEKYEFFQNISQAFKEIVNENYGSTYILNENMNLLYDLYHYPNKEENKSCQIEYKNFTELSNISNIISNEEIQENILIKNFNHLKERNFDLSLLELIQFNWIKERNIQEIKRIEILIKGILFHNMIKVSQKLDKKILIKNEIENILNIITNYEFDSFKYNLFLDIEKLVQFIAINLLINETEISMKEEEEEDIFIDFENIDFENFNEFKNNLSLIFFRYLFIEDITIKEGTNEWIYITKMINISSNYPNPQKNNYIKNLLTTLIGGN